MAFDTTQALQDARQAYHELMTGRAVVEIRDQNGELVRYGLQSARYLLQYIMSLEAQLGRMPAGPMQPVFCG